MNGLYLFIILAFSPCIISLAKKVYVDEYGPQDISHYQELSILGYDLDTARLRMRRSGGTTPLELSFEAMGKDFSMVLSYDNTIFGNNFFVQVIGSDGEARHRIDQTLYYKGHVKGWYIIYLRILYIC